MTGLFGNAYDGRRVMVTGHAGFKGSWLALWLRRMGARVIGYGLGPETTPSHYQLCGPFDSDHCADIRDQATLDRVFRDERPEIVFHLAAQALVRRSYANPVETFESNVMGTVRVLEACRKCDALRAAVVISSDKCYENREWVWGYRETDPMGGHDPYAASKGCTELVTAAYRKSFFSPEQEGSALVASCRAGNVIGGGDWAEDRLLPDLVRAASQGKPTRIRSPGAIRPWQHVLEPLSGYLMVGARLLSGDRRTAEPWNFGPRETDTVPVRRLTEMASTHWPAIEVVLDDGDHPHEAGLLKIESSKARSLLGWRNVWDIETAVERTVSWYRRYYENGRSTSLADLDAYVARACEVGLAWVED